MEPRREEQNKAPPPSAEQKRKRFKIVKLEDRIAPSSRGEVKTAMTLEEVVRALPTAAQDIDVLPDLAWAAPARAGSEAHPRVLCVPATVVD
jgi:hypothetical protein